MDFLSNYIPRDVEIVFPKACTFYLDENNLQVEDFDFHENIFAKYTLNYYHQKPLEINLTQQMALEIIDKKIINNFSYQNKCAKQQLNNIEKLKFSRSIEKKLLREANLKLIQNLDKTSLKNKFIRNYLNITKNECSNLLKQKYPKRVDMRKINDDELLEIEKYIEIEENKLKPIDDD